jgi:hypothetical protein
MIWPVASIDSPATTRQGARRESDVVKARTMPVVSPMRIATPWFENVGTISTPGALSFMGWARILEEWQVPHAIHSATHTIRNSQGLATR